MLEVWSSRNGLQCAVTAEAAGPPFEAVLRQHNKLVERRTFDTHGEAVEFAIRAMHDALPTLSDISSRP